MKELRIRHTLLALLLRAWRDEGFELGTGQELRLRELLQRLPADTPRSSWAACCRPCSSKARPSSSASTRYSGRA